MRKLILILFVSVAFTACNDNIVFDSYQSLSGNAWHKDSIINFKFNPIDTISRNNLFINLRNNNTYQFSNLFVIVAIDFPDNNRIIDTLEYEMTDAQGNFLGEGFTDLKENKLEYKTNVIFPVTGEYSVNVQHAMRKGGSVEGIEQLEGITDVGLRIEKMKVND
jgi:gliding motility-associated lipoprotein GldH